MSRETERGRSAAFAPRRQAAGARHSERLSSKNAVAKAVRSILARWRSFARFLDAERIDLSNAAAERALRGVAFGRRNWAFAGCGEGGRRAAAVYSRIATCKLNDVDPRAWLADAPALLPDRPVTRIDALMS